MSIHRKLGPAVVAVLTAGLAACGGGGYDGGDNPPPPPAKTGAADRRPREPDVCRRTRRRRC